MSEQFDIITGLPRRKYMSQSRTSYRKSTDRQVDVFNNPKKTQKQTSRTNFLRLGTSKDAKKDFYNYNSLGEFVPPNKLPAPKNRLVNSISTNYNILSHSTTNANKYSKDLADSTKIAYRKNDLSKICDLGRLYAPNLNEEFKEKITGNEKVFHIGKGPCAEMLNIGKTYGPKAQIFRKYK